LCNARRTAMGQISRAAPLRYTSNSGRWYNAMHASRVCATSANLGTRGMYASGAGPTLGVAVFERTELRRSGRTEFLVSLRIRVVGAEARRSIP
jgi:hypothetical protein